MLKRNFALLVIVLAGCATAGQSGLADFNSQFSQAIPTSPKYKVEPLAAGRHQVVVYQGSALFAERTTRVSYLSKAAYQVMDRYCSAQGGRVSDVSLRDDVDDFGYVNMLGTFSCRRL